MNTVNIVSMFSFSFIQHALIVGLVLGICLPIVGIIVYLRKIIFLSDTIGQVTMTGASFSVLIASIFPALVFNNFLMIIIFTIIGAIFIQLLIDKIKDNQEISLLITHSIAISLVMVFLSMSEDYGANLFNILFGNINSISFADTIIIVGLSVIVMMILIGNYKKILLTIIDEAQARLQGFNVVFYKYLSTIIISIMICLAVKIIGVLLVSSLLALPIVSARLVASNLKQVVMISIMIAIISFIGGIIGSFVLDLPASALVVFITLVSLIICSLIRYTKGSK